MMRAPNHSTAIPTVQNTTVWNARCTHAADGYAPAESMTPNPPIRYTPKIDPADSVDNAIALQKVKVIR